MEDLTVFLVAIGALIVIIGFTILALLVYSGLFENVTVGAGSPPIGEVVVAYRFGRGPYKEAGQTFTEIAHIVPENKALGIYYDDPKRVPSHLTRYVVGSVIAQGVDVEPEEDMKKLFKEKGFKLMRLPAATNVIKTTFPHISSLSIFIAIFKVYPEMGAYVQDHKLCAHPYLEIYDGKTIHFMAPLAKQDEFYVPEMKKKGPEGEIIMEPDDEFYDIFVNPVTPLLESGLDVDPLLELDASEAEAIIRKTPDIKDFNTDELNGAESEASTSSSFEELKLDGDGDTIVRSQKADSPDSTTL